MVAHALNVRRKSKMKYIVSGLFVIVCILILIEPGGR
jgi:hypothetical protein